MKIKHLDIPIKNGNIYSNEFKSLVINQIMTGELTMESARRRYKIGGKCTVARWMDKNAEEFMIKKKHTSDKQLEQDLEIKRLKEENRILSLRAEYYEIMVDLAKERFDIDLKKNFPGIAANCSEIDIRKPK